MKLWHDDIRRPPEGWTWARTNEEAARLLTENRITEASLDHDLGLEDVDPDTPDAYRMRGTGPTTGVDLCRWMVENDLVPPKVRIHSYSPSGAWRMAAILEALTTVEIRAYDPLRDV